MKEKCLNGKVVTFVESLRELREMLPPKYKHQLITQPSSVIAICSSSIADNNLSGFCIELNRSGKFVPYYYADRRAFLHRSDFRLLVSYQKNNGKYSLIIGARKLGESFEEAAFRALYEETKFKVNELVFLGLISGGESMITISPDGNAAEGIDALYLTMVPANSIVSSNNKTLEFIWMTPDEVRAAIYMNKWQPAQVNTVHKLLSSILQLPEIYSLHQNAPTW